MIVVVEAISAVGVLVHLGLLWWFHERYKGTAVWPVIVATGLVVLSGLGFSAIAAGAAAPGLWLGWQAAMLAVGVRLYLSGRHTGPGRPEGR